MNKTRLILSSILFIFIAFTTTSCAGDYKNISPKEVKELMDSDRKDLLLLDVRTKGEYEKGHLENATLIPVQILTGRVNEIADFRDRKVIVYCAVGGRSSKASAYLSGQGFKKVYNMSGGIKAWSGLGYEIVH